MTGVQTCALPISNTTQITCERAGDVEDQGQLADLVSYRKEVGGPREGSGGAVREAI